MKRILFMLCLLGGLFPSIIALGDRADSSKPADKDATKKEIQYARDILPILSTHCFTCHGPDDENRKARLRLDTSEEAYKELRSGNHAVVPGNPKGSEMIARIFSTEEPMPPLSSKKALKESEKLLLKRWIEQGAEYQKHWAFVPPKRPNFPEVKNRNWPKNPIDYFTLAQMEARGLKPSPEADRYALARRVAIDLTGLPPTLQMADRFVKDNRPDAYEKYVDELLTMSSYGERWAAVWLDLARYADSNGYANDNPRTIWMYRDWVIKAINKNIPFDQFTIEQIAGDMLPKPTHDQLIATAFHRNTLTNDEGGTDNEEFRTAAVVDRVNTTFQVWMGITMACAQCHNHKYDPISQEEYFQVYAIFNNTEDNDAGDNRPNLTLYTPEQKKQRAKLQAEIGDLQKKVKQAGDNTKALQKRLKSLQQQLGRIRGINTPIMKELPKNRQRKTHIHIRGNFLSKGDPVHPGVPEIFHELPEGMVKNRLALAQWLVDPENPLTARVVVNRYWELLFGRGLVESSEDYGLRGKLPTHPKLLDWLATEFVRQKWDVQKLLRLMVTSATYRQTSRVTPELLQEDRDNRYYARGPRFRVPAEVVRDQALFASGLLSDKMYGPPVRPPRPNLNLRAAFGGGTDWNTSKGEDKYRRAIYTKWRRTTPYPSMVSFDASDRNVCTVKRPRTNTPLQALVTLNDPVYVEAAQALARRMVKEGGKSERERLHYGFRLCLIRPPQNRELDRLVSLYQKARDFYAKDPKAAQQMATQPLGPLPNGADPVEMAAWTVVGNVLLNLDEVFLKR